MALHKSSAKVLFFKIKIRKFYLCIFKCFVFTNSKHLLICVQPHPHLSPRPLHAKANRHAVRTAATASLAQLVEHALRKRMVIGSIHIGGLFRQSSLDDSCGLRTHALAAWRLKPAP